MASIELGEVSWERMIRAVEKVKQRLQRATAALNSAGVPYAVIGGNAVAAWVSRVDEAAVRNTADVDLLINRSDLPRIIEALSAAGFVYRHAGGIDFFLDGENAKFRDAVHVIFTGEKVREEYYEPAPDLSETESVNQMSLLTLESLVRMKLTSNRDKDRTHIRDFIDVGLIDQSWTSRFRPELAERLQSMLDTPEGELHTISFLGI